jgi:hypothetical protein
MLYVLENYTDSTFIINYYYYYYYYILNTVFSSPV